MKKILFLLLICIIKLNAYEYIVYNHPNAPDGYVREGFYTDESGIIKFKSVYTDGSVKTTNGLWSSLIRIRLNYNYYIDNNIFQNYYKNDLKFLNDLYLNTYNKNQFLNYLYNPNSFSSLEYIEYNNVEILYNSDGLAVESIVNGKWAGLYDDSGQSGYLYNQKGGLIYVNGEPASFLEKINNKLLKRFKINLESIFIKKIFYPLLVLIFACVVLRSVIRLAIQAFLIRFYDKKISQLEKRREKIENA